jgi:glycine/D-amino acid oxidase-like deaminating enzyme
MSHRDPASPGWALAQQSKAMWQQLAAGGGQQASPALLSALEWQANGSLLLATTDAEVQQLAARAVMLQQQGVKGVVLLSPRELAMLEPALVLPPGSRGLLVKSDAQIVSVWGVVGGMAQCASRQSAAFNRPC